MLSSLSIQTRFLIAPLIGVVLTIILYLTSNHIIRSYAELFHNLSETNLTQITEISEITLLITASNSEIITLLLESEQLDEEGMYVEGKKQLNQLYDIEERIHTTLQEKNKLIIDNVDILQQVQTAFSAYKTQVIIAIEMSSVDVKQASHELMFANKKLKELTNLLLTLSYYYSNELSYQAELVEGTLYKKTYITELTIILLLLMLWSAFYFAKNTSVKLSNVYNALINLSNGDTDIVIHQDKDSYFQDIWHAVSEFKESVKTSEIYECELLMQKFAIDQHAIIATTDLKGTITSVNSKFCQISGYTADELIGSNHRILNSGHHSIEFWHNMFKTVSKGNVWHDEVLNKAKEGHLYWVDTTIIPISSGDNKLRGYIAIRTDITDKKSQYEKLVNANKVAESAVLAKSQFLAAMSHEIRTPMNGVIGMLDLMLEDELSETQKHRAQIAYSSAKSLLILINDILDFSKIEAGKLAIETISFDLKELLSEFTQFMRFQAQEKNLTLTLHCDELKESMMTGDPNRIRQILTNIVGNAIKFTHHGEITLSASLKPVDENQWNLQCDITDTGIGIPDDKMPNLFDAFSQVDISDTRKYGGTGLGLAISQRLTKLMDGDISVTSEVGKGSCFTFNIILEKSTENAENNTVIHTPSAKLAIPQWPSDVRILLVEDNRVNQLVAQGVLKRFGLTAEVANHGLEALAMLTHAEPPFSIVLMDCQMPKMDGYSTSRNIRINKNNEYDQNIPIIAMTANAMKGDRAKCLSAGMNDYLTKPISPEILLEKLKHWLLKE